MIANNSKDFTSPIGIVTECSSDTLLTNANGAPLPVISQNQTGFNNFNEESDDKDRHIIIPSTGSEYNHVTKKLHIIIDTYTYDGGQDVWAYDCENYIKEAVIYDNW